MVRRRQPPVSSRAQLRRLLNRNPTGPDEIDNLAVRKRHLWPKLIGPTELGSEAVQPEHLSEETRGLLAGGRFLRLPVPAQTWDGPLALDGPVEAHGWDDPELFPVSGDYQVHVDLEVGAPAEVSWTLTVDGTPRRSGSAWAAGRLQGVIPAGVVDLGDSWTLEADGLDISGGTVTAQLVEGARPQPEPALEFDNLFIDWDAATIGVSDGQPVTVWPDATGNGFDLTNRHGENPWPLLRAGAVNGLPAVDFDGGRGIGRGSNNVWSASGEREGPDPLCAYMVVEVTSLAALQWVYGKWDATSTAGTRAARFHVNHDDVSGSVAILAPTAGFLRADDAVQMQWHIVSAHFVSGQFAVWVDGVQVGSWADDEGGSRLTSIHLGYRRATNDSINDPFPGKIARMLCFEGDAGQRQQVEQYLSAMYGVPL